MPDHNPLELIKRVKALADTGLLYAESAYDQERYQELSSIGQELLRIVSGQPLTALDNFFMPTEDYPTPKVDVRGLVLNEAREVLLVKELVDRKWSVPGGWCEIGYTPSQVITKEIQEEAGLLSRPVRLLAVYDKRCHPHPPQPHYVYKLIFLCEVTGGSIRSGFDVEEVGFFSPEQLPSLSEDRILSSQIEHLYQLAQDDQAVVYFD